MNLAISVLALSVLVTSCASTPARLMEHSVAASLTSTKSPQELAACIADHMTGGSVRNDGQDHYWVVRDSGFGGVAIGRWDIYRISGGSRADWRRATDLTTGVGAGRACV